MSGPAPTVSAVRQARVADVRHYLATVTREELRRTIVLPDDGIAWPFAGVEVAECLQIILIEEWEHRRYAERDLAALDAG